LNSKTLIILTGPTASGKTSLAIELALHLSTEIVSADSRQCYRELNIGVAKPDQQQLAAVPHHFINSHSIFDDVNAAVFSEYAHKVLDTLFVNRDTAVMAGGTGLYIRAFTDGLTSIPKIPADLRRELRGQYDKNGLDWLKDELIKADPLYAAEGEMKNPQRMLRALEVKKATGVSIKQYHSISDDQRHYYNIRKFAVEISRDQLYHNINHRVDQMVNLGLIEEARSLLPFRHLNALQTVGYAELFDYFDGRVNESEAIDKIKQHTRNYAKRQLTWFRKEEGIKWIKGIDDILQAISV
jgi:tRNA dimethylallyltransferase